MALNLSNSATGTSFPTFGRFFSWWFGELGGLLRLSRKGDQAAQPSIVARLDGERVMFQSRKGGQRKDIGALSLAEANADHPVLRAVHEANRRKQAIALAIPATSGLEKVIELPAAVVEDDLGELLGFEITRQTPFAIHQVFFDFAVVGREPASGKIRVRLLVVPKDAVAETINRLSSFELRPESIELVGDDGATAILQLNRAAHRGTGNRRFGKAATILIIAAFGFLAVAAGAPFYAKQVQEKELRAELLELRKQTSDVQDMRDAIKDAINANSFLHIRKRSHPSMLDVIERLSRLIPDDTWLNRIDVENDTLEIAGVSPQASALIGVIDASPRFTEVQFEAPVTRDPKDNTEKFIISARVRQPEISK